MTPTNGRSYHVRFNHKLQFVLLWLIADYGLPSAISRRLESTTSSFDVQHGGRTKYTCSGHVLEAEHLRGEDIKMYHPWQQPWKKGFCDVLRRAAWRPAGLNVGGGTRDRFEGGFLIHIVPSKRRTGQSNCSSSLFRPVRRTAL